jgi:hypothetical protein
MAGKSPAKQELGLTISVHNDAGVPAGTLRQAEGDAAQVLRKAGITVTWLNCGEKAAPRESDACGEASFPAHLHVRVAREPLRVGDKVLGISYLSADGTGCQADLFYERMEELQRSSHANLATLLGHVAAHEVGHLLLGTNSHVAAGIMQAQWTGEKLAGVNLARLYFSPTESARMRERLAAGLEAQKQVTRFPETRVGD